jgi:hypothetical protein
MNDVIRLFSKIALLLLPLVVALMLFLLNAQSPVSIKQQLIREKIDRLIVASTSTTHVIIAGESRAEQGVVPEVFTEKTGLSAVNIAVADGAMSEEYDALNDAHALQGKHLVILGISSYEMNDRMLIFLQPLDSASINNESWSIEKLSDIAAFANARLLYYIQQFKSFYKGTLHDTGHMDAETFRNKGWRYGTAVYVPGKNNERNNWQIEFDGVKNADFKRAIAGFATSTDTLVLFTGPVAPSAKRELAYESTIDMEKEFAERINTMIAPYPNIYFIDFRTEDLPELTDEKFDDAEHLNAEGARIFTSILVKTIKQRHVIK